MHVMRATQRGLLLQSPTTTARTCSESELTHVTRQAGASIGERLL